MITRRHMAGVLAAFATSRRARAAGPAYALDHFKLRVSDLDRSVAFYYRLFGGPLSEIQGGSVPSPPNLRAVFFKMGSGKTYMIQSPPDAKVPVGLEHISVDEAAMAVVRQHRLPLAFPGESYVRDPDGNLLEFLRPGYWTWENVAKHPPKLPPDLAKRQPAFDPVVIQRVTLKVSDMTRAAGFYSLFGTELPAPKSKGRRQFDFKGTVLELVSSKAAPGLDGFTVAVRNFDAAAARRALAAMVSTNWNHTAVCPSPSGTRTETSWNWPHSCAAPAKGGAAN